MGIGYFMAIGLLALSLTYHLAGRLFGWNPDGMLWIMLAAVLCLNFEVANFFWRERQQGKRDGHEGF